MLVIPFGYAPLISLIKSYLATVTNNGQYGQAFMHATIRSHQESDSAKQDPHQELQAYLNAPVEEVEDVVAWWGVCILSLIWGMLSTN